MSLPVVTRPRAAAEIQSAYRWYEQQREGLEGEFLASVDRMVEIIANHPEAFPIVHRDIRRAFLRRFPYSVLYRIKTGHIVVVGCFHSKRDPKSWHGRR